MSTSCNYTYIYLLIQMNCIISCFTHELHAFLNKLYYIKTVLKLKDIYLLNFLTMYIVNCTRMVISHIYIAKSVAVYTGYVVTEHAGNMNKEQHNS
jgi:hypothetical protein